MLADPIQSLLQTCIESAVETLRILLALQEEGVLGSHPITANEVTS